MALKTTLLGLDMVWLEAECSRYEFFADVVGQTHPDIGVVALDSDPDKGSEARRAAGHGLARVQHPGGQRLDRRHADPARMRAGAKEFLPKPVQDRRSGRGAGPIERAAHRPRRRAKGRQRRDRHRRRHRRRGHDQHRRQPGLRLAQDPKNTVALVDLDLSLGDADVFLDTIPDYTLVDVAQNVTRLDFTLLKRSLTKHSSGLFLLPRPVQLEDSKLITADDMQRVFGLLKATFTHLILDLSKAYSAIDMVAMEAATQILLVTQLDLPCLRNVVRLMMSFNEHELKDKVKVIVNRAGLDTGQISLKKAQETIGREIFWQLPNDYRTMVEVRNNGVPLIEQAPKAGHHAIDPADGAGAWRGRKEPRRRPDAAKAGKKGGWIRRSSAARSRPPLPSAARLALPWLRTTDHGPLTTDFCRVHSLCRL